MGASPTKQGSLGADMVIIPVDETDQAEKAFDYYLKHMHKADNEVKVIHCYEPPKPPPSYFERPRISSNLSVAAAVEWEARIEKSHEETKNLIKRYEDKLSQNQVKGDISTELVHSSPGETIVKALDKHKADYCVMGSRGLGLIRRAVVGSVSKYVIDHSQVPVTVVPPETPSWLF